MKADRRPGQPPGEPAEDSMVADLRAELEASLSAGFVASAGLVPNGWTREISWEPRGEKRILVAIVVSSLASPPVGSQRTGEHRVPFGLTDEVVVKAALQQLTGYRHGYSRMREVTIPQLWQPLSAGDVGSQAVAIAKDLLHLADIKVLQGQDLAVAEELDRLLGLGPIAQDLVTGWAMHGEGRAL